MWISEAGNSCSKVWWWLRGIVNKDQRRPVMELTSLHAFYFDLIPR